MSLLLIDGCEDLSSWRLVAAPTNQPGRYGNCIQTTTSGINAVYDVRTADQSDTFTVGFAYKTTNISTNPVIMDFYSDNATQIHNRLQIESSGAVSFERSSTSLGTSVTGLIANNVWYYIEMQAKLGDSPNGSATVRVNGTTVISLTGVDTKNAGTKTVYDALVIEGSSGATQQVDDLYFMSGAGDSFLGPILVETLYPDGNGDTNDWIGSDGDSTDNYLLVDEVPPVTTDYVTASTVGEQDLYTLTDLFHTTGTIVGVCHSVYAAATDAVNPLNVKALNRRSSTTASPASLLTTTYRSHDYALVLDPETAAAWTIADVNSLQSGVELA
jgi:hypothetical protein